MSPAIFNLRRVLSVFAAAAIAGGLLVATSGDRAQSTPLTESAAKQMYAPTAISSRKKSDCAPSRGMFIGLQTKRRVRTNLSGLGEFARSSKPKSAVAMINGKRFRLRIDGASSGYGFRQVWWGFEAARFSGKAPKRIDLRYRLGGRTVAASIRVTRSACD